MAKITKRAVDILLTAAGQVTIRDEDVIGFCARKNNNGSVSYFVEYRSGRGRGFPVRRMVLGKHGKLTADQARDQARLILARVVAGADPAGERAASKKERTVAEVLQDALDHHWKPKRRVNTATNFEGMIKRTLIPEFGTKRLIDLKRSDIRAWHARQVHRPRQANLDLAILRKALSIAVADELISDNPAKGISLHPERKRDRVPTDSELKEILGAISRVRIRPSAALLFRLLILTGCRLSEWRLAKCEWIDAANGTLKLPDAKAGGRDVPLSDAVVALLVKCSPKQGFVIPDDDGASPLTPAKVRDAWEAVCKTGGVANLRVHDLRHAFATRGAGLGATALVLRDALGHRSLTMTSRYVSHQMSSVRALSEKIAAEIAALESSNPLAK